MDECAEVSGETAYAATRGGRALTGAGAGRRIPNRTDELGPESVVRSPAIFSRIR